MANEGKPTTRTDLIEKRRSRLHGWGVFAKEAIAKNTRLTYYAGQKITTTESVERERRYLERGHIWCFQLNRRWVRDGAVGGNIARYVNHSCRPNCYIQIAGDTIWVRAARAIAPGDELTYNYHTDGEGSIRCRCRPGCKTLL